MTSMSYTELLAMRELSVDAYWEELRDPRRRPPNELDIPVPLWPGESRQQYEREFYRWLASHRLSPALMREDPVTERKWRRQFAQTRVARPQKPEGEGSQRAPAQRAPRSPSPLRRPNGVERSRSRSRSQSPLRRFNVMERSYPVRGEDNRPYAPSFERRPSPDSGRPFPGRQAGDRQQQDRSYSRERPRAPHVAPPEAPRAYINRQYSQTSDPRGRLDSRAPSPQNAHRQHVGDGQRWSKSPSRSPQYSRAPSPSPVDRSPPQVRRPASAPYIDNFRKQLLARRVISVEAFRDEMYKLRHGFIREYDLKRPHETMVRIPILLWAGESMAQYTQKFERWLESRNIPLASLRDYSAKERSLWHSFAYTRAGTSDFAEPVRPSSRSRSPPRIRSCSRSRSRSSTRSIRRSSERGRPPMPATYMEDRPLKKGFAPNGAYMHHSEQQQRPKSPPSTTAPPENPHLFNNKTRRQLLERRIVSLDAFQKEVDHNPGVRSADVTGDDLLPAIPVPLHPGESMGLFDHRFWTWLKDYNETKDSLRGNPARERRLRMAFAYVRVSKPQAPAKAGSQTTGALGSRPSVKTHAKIPLGVLKSARARLGMNAKRVADDDSERNGHPQYLRDEPGSKRARIVTEDKTPVPGMSYGSLPANTAQKRSSTAATLASSQLASATRMNSARPLTSAASAASRSVGSVRSSMPSRTTAAPAPVKMRSPPSLIAPGSRRPITIIPKSVTPQKEPATPAAPVRSTKPVIAMSKSPTTTMGVSAPLQSSAPLQKIMPRREKAVVGVTVPQSSSAPLQKIKPRPEQTASSRNKPVDSQAPPRSLMPAWHKRVSESTSSTPSPAPVVKAASASSSSSASPAAEAPRKIWEGMTRNWRTPAAAAGTSTWTSRSADRPIASAASEKPTTGVDAIEQDAADVSATQSEPNTTPAESADMSDADSNSADESEGHDGDVTNPDGCCCPKCMRSWARTLTDRMDQLEQNVLDLKHEVVTRTGDQTTPVTSS